MSRNYRIISYSVMICTVFLSWGLMLRVAYSQDQATGDTSGAPRAIANIAPKAYLIPHDTPASIQQPATAASGDINEVLPRVKKASTVPPRSR